MRLLYANFTIEVFPDAVGLLFFLRSLITTCVTCIQLAHLAKNTCFGHISELVLTHCPSTPHPSFCSVTFSRLILFFYLLTNTFSSHDLFPPLFHHMTLSPDRLPIVLTM